MKIHPSYQTKNKNGLPVADHRNNIKNISKHKRLFARIAIRIFNDGLETLNRRAHNSFEENPNAVVVDLGIGDSKLLKYFNKKIKSKTLYGLDTIDNNDPEVKIIITDLEKKFPLENHFCDVVISSQNIEHIVDVPLYCDEIARILKPKGYAVILTENLASWINIGALFWGWLPFSLASTFGVPFGNPLVWHSELHTREDVREAYEKRLWGVLGHQHVLTIKAYKDLFAERGFTIERIITGGCGLFWGVAERVLSKIDKTHSHFIGLKIRKKGSPI